MQSLTLGRNLLSYPLWVPALDYREDLAYSLETDHSNDLHQCYKWHVKPYFDCLNFESIKPACVKPFVSLIISGLVGKKLHPHQGKLS